MENKDKWCFAWLNQQAPNEATKAALVKAAKWNPGDIVTVSFLDGVPSVKERVAAAAREWVAPGLANLELDFRNDTDTNIRISFMHKGSWSMVGTECRFVAPGKATMNYGWLEEDSDEEEVRSVVLHEFGHALGLIHEHQNPAGGIEWDRDQVIADLSGPPNHWTLETIEHNMFRPHAVAETNFTSLDPESIMMYPIPSRWTKDGFNVGLNSELSGTDKDFMKEQYPLV